MPRTAKRLRVRLQKARRLSPARKFIEYWWFGDSAAHLRLPGGPAAEVGPLLVREEGRQLDVGPATRPGAKDFPLIGIAQVVVIVRREPVGIAGLVVRRALVLGVPI